MKNGTTKKKEEVKIFMERFTTNGHYIYDTYNNGTKWIVNQVEAQEIVTIMNNLNNKARQRSLTLSKLEKEHQQLKNYKKLFNRFQECLEDVEKLIELDNTDFNELKLLCKGTIFDDKEGWKTLKID